MEHHPEGRDFEAAYLQRIRNEGKRVVDLAAADGALDSLSVGFNSVSAQTPT